MGEAILRLNNRAQNYAWGKIGGSSLVTAFLPQFEETKPYAELWVGTHSSLESHVGESRLSSVVGSLSYLLKILSVAMPLSIQIHPSRIQAERLHARDPTRYPDANHKPELCVALTRMNILCGLKTEPEMAATLSSVSEMQQLLESETGAREKIARLLLDEEKTKRLTREYLERTRDSQDEYSRLARQLDQHFPADVGIFLALLMNHITLEPGEALFIEDGVPHAYLSGDCVEAQACSDNVVRCGLTPKPKDPATLLSLVAVEKAGKPATIRLSGNEPARKFEAPCDDFELWEVTNGGRLECDGPTCIVVTDGEGTLVGATSSTSVRKGDSCVLLEDIEVLGSAVIYACMRGVTS